MTDSLSIEHLLDMMSDCLVGIWKYNLASGPKWCATVHVEGQLVDTENHESMRAAIVEAGSIVDMIKQGGSIDGRA